MQHTSRGGTIDLTEHEPVLQWLQQSTGLEHIPNESCFKVEQLSVVVFAEDPTKGDVTELVRRDFSRQLSCPLRWCDSRKEGVMAQFVVPRQLETCSEGKHYYPIGIVLNDALRLAESPSIWFQTKTRGEIFARKKKGQTTLKKRPTTTKRTILPIKVEYVNPSNEPTVLESLKMEAREPSLSSSKESDAMFHSINTDQSQSSSQLDQLLIESQQHQIAHLQQEVASRTKDTSNLLNMVRHLLGKHYSLKTEVEQLRRQNHFFTRLIEQEILNFVNTRNEQQQQRRQRRPGVGEVQQQQVGPNDNGMVALGGVGSNVVPNRPVLSHVVGHEDLGGHSFISSSPQHQPMTRQ